MRSLERRIVDLEALMMINWEDKDNINNLPYLTLNVAFIKSQIGIIQL